ncbi:MAG TPA: hypothetical protein VLV31_11065 [Candidatus Acidoferrales bacterium]|nr:hypothetical protein [Candidatus Acidoferrales bacterium]
MDDEELQRLLDLTDKELCKLYNLWMDKFRESAYITDRLFTKSEKRAWSKNKPNFPKQIAH